MLKMLEDFFKNCGLLRISQLYVPRYLILIERYKHVLRSKRKLSAYYHVSSVTFTVKAIYAYEMSLVSTMCCYGYSIGFFSWLAQFQEPFGSRVTRSSAWEQNKKTSIIVVASNSHTWVLGVVYTFWAFLSSTSIIFVVFLFSCCHGLVVNFHVSYKVFCKDFRASGLLGWTRKAWKSLVFGGIF